MSCRHARRRQRARQLKNDVHILLGKIANTGATVDDLLDEINEMRVRLKPPTGAAAPSVLTGYTEKRRLMVDRVRKSEWAADAVLRRDGSVAVRYKKD